MDGIIFDLDGTLWDSREVVAKAWNKAIKEHSDLNMTVDVPLLSTLFGKSMKEISDQLFPMLPDAERTKLAIACYEYENELLETEPGVLFSGVRETLTELSKEYPLFIVSNCQCGYIEVFMKGCHLEHLFTDFLCFGDTSMPKGYNIKKLMEKNALHDVIYLGDTQHDADACKEAGVPFVFAAYGFGKVPDATKVITTFSEINKFL